MAYGPATMSEGNNIAFLECLLELLLEWLLNILKHNVHSFTKLYLMVF